MYVSDWSSVLHFSGRKKVFTLESHLIVLLLVRLTSLSSNTDFTKFTITPGNNTEFPETSLS